MTNDTSPDVAKRLAEIRERHDELQSKGAIYTEVETQTLARSDVPWLLSLVEGVGKALAALPDQHYHGIANRLEQMKNGERVADRLDALRDAAQEGADAGE